MKLAHLILAHNEPVQLERLVKRLLHPEATIYIHLDKKTNIAPFKYLQEIESVIFIDKRIKIYWAASNMVKATLNGFKQIIASGNNYDYVNLLSGQDYPLKSQPDIHNYLSQNPGKAFMNYLLFNPDWLEAFQRTQSYHFNNWQFFGRDHFQKIVNKIFPKRKFPNQMIPVGRSQWFTISLECTIYLIDYWENNKSLRHFVKFTWAPDEFIFQTILYNSVHRNKMVNDDLRYIDWSAGGVSPKILTMDDAEKLVSCGKLFARKFDAKKDEAVLNFIDKSIG